MEATNFKKTCEVSVKCFTLSWGGFSDVSIEKYFAKMQWKHVICISTSADMMLEVM